MTRTLKVAVIGAGMAGQAHAFGYRNVSMAGSGELQVELWAIADPNVDLARTVATRYGFAEAIGNMDDVISSDCDIISVALPNFLHADILPRVLASGKHVFAEKPIGRTLAEATHLRGLADASNAVTGVGFSFRRLPGLAGLAQAVHSGLIGELHTARAWYNADYAANPASALSWRYSGEQAGAGALLDIGAHAIDALHFVAGPTARVTNATVRTVIAERPLPAAGAIGHGGSTSAETGPVTNDDVALLTLQLESGAIAHVELSRIAHGIPNSLGVEVHGTRGSASFDSMSAGEFHVFQDGVVDATFNGARRIITGPAHPYFTDVAAMPGAGVGTGYAEAFTAEIQEFIRTIHAGSTMDTNFETAEVMMRVVDAALRSATTEAPVSL
ncbi:putative dehydrogenase [Microbacteriaceae bacterium MWH-Ta3]|nr:putative dehydrogenase [Microbacteriaceae bacterium MWH-Ta3]